MWTPTATPQIMFGRNEITAQKIFWDNNIELCFPTHLHDFILCRMGDRYVQLGRASFTNKILRINECNETSLMMAHDLKRHDYPLPHPPTLTRDVIHKCLVCETVVKTGV